MKVDGNYTLYTVNMESIACKIVEEELKKLHSKYGFNYETHYLDEEGCLGYIHRDLGIDKLPALSTREGMFVGYKEILEYLKRKFESK